MEPISENSRNVARKRLQLAGEITNILVAVAMSSNGLFLMPGIRALPILPQKQIPSHSPANGTVSRRQVVPDILWPANPFNFRIGISSVLKPLVDASPIPGEYIFGPR